MQLAKMEQWTAIFRIATDAILEILEIVETVKLDLIKVQIIHHVQFQDVLVNYHLMDPIVFALMDFS